MKIAGTDRRGPETKPSEETRRGTPSADEELKRTLDRDTAVQGEREEDDDAPSPARDGTGSTAPTPPAPPGRTPSK